MSLKAMDGSKVVIIGAGPTGLMAAAHLAKLGAEVTVFEKRSYEDQQQKHFGWTIGVAGVGRKAIEEAGLSTDFGPAAKSEGSSSQHGLQEPKYFGQWSGMGIDASKEAQCTRDIIVEHLREQCQKVYPDLISFSDGYSIVGGNLLEGEVILAPADPSEFEGSGKAGTNFGVNGKLNGASSVNGAVNGSSGPAGDTLAVTGMVKMQADIVVAADGAGSQTRVLLQQLDPKLKVTRERNYSSTLPFYMPPQGDPLDYRKLPTPSGKPWHGVPEYHTDPISGSWACFQYPEPGADPGIIHFFFTCRAGGKELSGLLTCKADWWRLQRSEEELRQALMKAFPQLPTAWLEICAAKCCNSYDGALERRLRTSSFVTCNKLGSGRTILMGDAAHASSPNLGYGATSGMADAAVLGSCVEKLLSEPPKGKNDVIQSVSEKLGGIGEAWTRERLADALAYVRFSKAFSDLGYLKYHKNPWLIVRQLPVLVPAILSFSPRFAGSGVFRPPKFISALLSTGERPADIEWEMVTMFWSWAAVFGVATAAGVGLTARALTRAR